MGCSPEENGRGGRQRILNPQGGVTSGQNPLTGLERCHPRHLILPIAPPEFCQTDLLGESSHPRRPNFRLGQRFRQRQVEEIKECKRGTARQIELARLSEEERSCSLAPRHKQLRKSG